MDQVFNGFNPFISDVLFLIEYYLILKIIFFITAHNSRRIYVYFYYITSFIFQHFIKIITIKVLLINRKPLAFVLNQRYVSLFKLETLKNLIKNL